MYTASGPVLGMGKFLDAASGCIHEYRSRADCVGDSSVHTLQRNPRHHGVRKGAVLRASGGDSDDLRNLHHHVGSSHGHSVHYETARSRCVAVFDLCRHVDKNQPDIPNI